jgi:hypothetical protein
MEVSDRLNPWYPLDRRLGGPTAGLDIEPQILGRPERKYYFFLLENCCKFRQVDSYETFRIKYFTSLLNIVQVMQNVMVKGLKPPLTGGEAFRCQLWAIPFTCLGVWVRISRHIEITSRCHKDGGDRGSRSCLHSTYSCIPLQPPLLIYVNQPNRSKANARV